MFCFRKNMGGDIVIGFEKGLKDFGVCTLQDTGYLSMSPDIHLFSTSALVLWMMICSTMLHTLNMHRVLLCLWTVCTIWYCISSERLTRGTRFIGHLNIEAGLMDSYVAL